jgi:serine/threonine protein kinase
VFSAEPEDWVRYLTLPPSERYEPEPRVHAYFDAKLGLGTFEPANEASRWLSDLLDQGLRGVARCLAAKPHVLAIFEQLAYARDAQRGNTVVLLSPFVPSDGTREVAHEGADFSSDVQVVLQSHWVRHLYERILASSWMPPDRRMGFYWPIVSRLLSELAYPLTPIDRFAAKVEVFAKLIYVAINVLYEGKRGGRLQPSSAGEVYESFVSGSSGIARGQLEDRHPYFRMLATLGFLVRGEPFASYATEVRVAAREYLDDFYLRLSLSGAMPEVPEPMQPMPFERKQRKVRTPKPRVGYYGIQTNDDLDAWKAVSNPFRDIGFTLLAQVGIGEFGRVYDVLNDSNPRYPARLALKVDRIQGKKKQAILEAEQAMQIGRELASAHHLIRLYDTGKLRSERYTYHVLQLVDGDTLDNLFGVTGTEHASVSRPPRARQTQAEGRQEFERALSMSGSQLWRRQRLALPFAHALSPAMILDLLTSVLLWLQEVHALNYAINDLKNGNLMMSRRGQLKGIDLDSYAPVHTSNDKVADFMFLAVSLVLMLFSASGRLYKPRVAWDKLIQDEERLRNGLHQAWPFGNIERLSEGRVSEEELSSALIDLVLRSRQLVYTNRPDLFSDDVARLVNLKRRLLPEEFVID